MHSVTPQTHIVSATHVLRAHTSRTAFGVMPNSAAKRVAFLCERLPSRARYMTAASSRVNRCRGFPLSVGACPRRGSGLFVRGVLVVEGIEGTSAISARAQSSRPPLCAFARSHDASFCRASAEHGSITTVGVRELVGEGDRDESDRSVCTIASGLSVPRTWAPVCNLVHVFSKASTPVPSRQSDTNSTQDLAWQFECLKHKKCAARCSVCCCLLLLFAQLFLFLSLSGLPCYRYDLLET